VSAFAPGAEVRSVSGTNSGDDPFTMGVPELRLREVAALQRQANLVGHGRLPVLRPARAAGLVGRPVGRVPRAGGQAALRNAFAFGDVDRRAALLPLHVAGAVRGTDAGEVAIAVNGRIRVVAPLIDETPYPQFSAILPESALRDGANQVEVLEVSGPPRSPRLRSLQRVGGAGGYVLAANAIRTPDGRRLRIVRGTATGGVDRSVRDGGVVHLSGWAAQARRFHPVDEIVGFRAGRPVFFGRPDRSRPDIGRLHGVPPVGLGFAFDLPAQTVGARLQVFALSGGAAAPLSWFCRGGVRQDVGC
jgi:hypothetical protein